jgi:hypothetical protein
MASTSVHPQGRRPLAAAACFLALAAGCDGGVGTCYPVSGRVLVNGQPLRGKTGSVVLKPDATKGNGGTLEPLGKFDAEGNYQLFTKGKRGAPLGWYKVVVTAGAGQEASMANRAARGGPASAVPLPFDPRYVQATTTTLSVEVVTAPDDYAYDLKLLR